MDVEKNSDVNVNGAVVAEAYKSQAPAKVHWYRGTTFQAIVVGVASFLAPGAYAALASTGAGGLANVEIGNASTAIAYALIVPSALFATGTLAKVGPMWSLAIGATGYAPYAAALYCNSAFATQWFLIFGAIICGLTSGIFWVSEGAIIMIYAEPERKGKLLAYWQSIYNSATCIGGAINLALNVNINVRGGLQPKTYLVFVALNCIAPLSAFFLSNPEKVQRKDRKPVPAFPAEGFWREAYLTIMELKDTRIIACCFLWSQPLFVPSFLGTYLAKNFSVRVRGLSSLVKPILAIVWFQVMGLYLDNKRISIRVKILTTYAALQVVGVACLIWLLVLTLNIQNAPVATTYDWLTSGFAAYWVPVLLCNAAQAVSYGYMYYMAGYVFPREADGVRTSRIIATLRSAESGSAAIAFGINSVGTKLSSTAIINLVFQIVCLFCGAYVIQYIWKKDKEGAFDEPIEEVIVPEMNRIE